MRFSLQSNSGRQPVLALVRGSQISVATESNVDGSTSSRLTFAKVYVPAESVIATGAEARKLALQLNEFLMLGAAIELVGLAAAALDVTLDYIKLRQQFGKPIGSFQVLQHRAVNGFIDIELNRSLAYRVLAAYDAGEHHPAMVSAVKARASRGALEITRAAFRCTAPSATPRSMTSASITSARWRYPRATGRARPNQPVFRTDARTRRSRDVNEPSSHDRPLICAVDSRGIATLVFNRPEKRNSYNQVMIKALFEEMVRLGTDPSVRALVLRGTGQHFSAGADVSERHDPADRSVCDAGALYLALDSMPKPLIALVQGACIGAQSR